MGSPLRVVTLSTGDLAACRRFYCGVLQMRELPEVGSAAEVSGLNATQARLWALPPEARWSVAYFASPGLSGGPVLRVLEFSQPGPLIRPGFDLLLEGGLAVGFAVRDLQAVAAAAREHGFPAPTEPFALTLYREDGSRYQAMECPLVAPDQVYVPGVARPADLGPVGPIAPGYNVGGPSFATLVANHADPVLEFFSGVLDYQVRRDLMLTEDNLQEQLRVPPHTPIRYVTMFARGSNGSNVAFLDFGDSGRKNPAPLGPPSRGLVMWSFRVRDLDAALARVRARGLEVVCEPLRLEMPSGTQAVATVRAPNGFLVELVGDSPQEPVGLSGTAATRAPAARSR